jgi:glucosamine-phosphate N-acetyltransferase
MIIREFSEEDTDGLLNLLKEVWSITNITSETLNKFHNNDNILFIVEDGGLIIGSLTLHLQYKLIRDGGIAGLIEEVVIKDPYRGRGIGSLLITEAIKKAKSLGCYKIILSCFPERVSFYERNGFNNESITMRYSNEIK